MTHRLEEPIPVRNADGSISQGGSIKEFFNIIISAPPSFWEHLNLEVIALGQFDIILGFPWLQRHNPKVDWKDRTLELLPEITLFMHTAAGVPESGKDTAWTEDPYADLLASIGLDSVPKAFDFLWDPIPQEINGVVTGDTSHKTTVEEDMKMFVLEKYWDFKDVFLRTNFDALPPYSEYDHTINLKDSFKPQHGKIYPLSPRKQVALDKFLEEHFATGRIRCSNSPQATPFFFTPKVEEVNAPGIDPGLHPIQDYHYLNAHTVRDYYPLSLLSEILQNPKFQTAKHFTVIDIC
jgi:hypothetical protein